MKDYISLRLMFEPCNSDITDLMASYLADVGYESFVAEENCMTAYIEASAYNESVLAEIITGFPMQTDVSYVAEFVEGKDWNEEWERNYFQPIVIDDQCVIHSTFHQNVPKAEYDIIIDPKMAFGTGHHATTCMMIRGLLSIDLKGKSVIDMGTGTGILAILSSMRGASPVVGIEIDSGACINARDNVSLNGQSVQIIEGDSSSLASCEAADVFLANINRNIILADLPRYVEAIKAGGHLLLSGFYEKDIPLILKAASVYGLVEVNRYKMGEDWASLHMRKCIQ
ncbi:MAG: 50S ribosomal protein L11 methyltransferase [Muribaculaceae bacterium]|nr:50S ribosomal protein L11 methyltransferase [Muribaculaceae bacterium]